jgi:hypothetical protein
MAGRPPAYAFPNWDSQAQSGFPAIDCEDLSGLFRRVTLDRISHVLTPETPSYSATTSLFRHMDAAGARRACPAPEESRIPMEPEAEQAAEGRKNNLNSLLPRILSFC